MVFYAMKQVVRKHGKITSAPVNGAGRNLFLSIVFRIVALPIVPNPITIKKGVK